MHHSTFDAALAFAQAWATPLEAGDDGVTPEEARAAWTAAGCDALPPPMAFLVSLAALRLGPDHAGRLLTLAAEVARQRAADAAAGMMWPGLGLGIGDAELAPPPAAPLSDNDVAALCETDPERVARAFARLYAETMGGNIDLERFLAAHAVAQLAIYHGGGALELQSAFEGAGYP